jgi:hypothetical protein
MARQSNPAQDPPRRFPWLLVLLVVSGGLYFFQKMGLKSVYRDETTSEVDFKSTENRNSPIPDMRDDEEPGVDRTIQNIDQLYGGEEITQHVPTEKAGTGQDEKLFYDNLKRLYAGDPQALARDVWLQKLKDARGTYRAVRGVFELASSTDLDETDLTPFLNNEGLIARLGAAVAKATGLPAGSFDGFKGKAISDWALQAERLRQRAAAR